MATLPDIPPILDVDRYILTNATSDITSIDVTFPVFGDGSDIQVRVAGLVLDPAKWTFTSRSGIPLNLLPLPISDGTITFDPILAASVGAPLTIEILGAWHPRRTIQPTAPGITRREFNQALSTVIAGMREAQFGVRRALVFSQSDVEGNGLLDALGAVLRRLGDPVEGSDAVNLQTLQTYVDSIVVGGGNVSPRVWTATSDGVSNTIAIPGADIASSLLYLVTLDGVVQAGETDFTIALSPSPVLTFVGGPPPAGVVQRVVLLGYARTVPTGVVDWSNITGKPAFGTTAGSFAAGDDARFSRFVPVADRAALKALNPSVGVAYLTEASREGVWRWDGTVPIATHQADAAYEGRYIAPNATAIGAWVAQMSVESGWRWTSDNPPVNVKRIGGRLFVGASVVNNGAAGAGRTHSWIDDSTYVGMTAGAASLEQNAQAAFVTNSGLGGILAATRTSDYPFVTGGTIAVTGWAFDDSANASGAWAGYFIGVRKPGGKGSIQVAEIGAWNQDADAPSINPYAMFPAGAIYTVHIANGIPASAGAAAPSFAASSAISIINNHETGGKFASGIVFKAESLAADVGGNLTAIAFGKSHRMAWYYDGGNVGAEIRSDVDSVAGDNRQSLVFSNFGVQVNNNVGRAQFVVARAANTINYLSVAAAAAGAATMIYASGETDVSLQITPKGGGEVQITGGDFTARIRASSAGLGFFGSAPQVKPTGVAITAAGVHAALVTLGLIAA